MYSDNIVHALTEVQALEVTISNRVKETARDGRTPKKRRLSIGKTDVDE